MNSLIGLSKLNSERLCTERPGVQGCHIMGGSVLMGTNALGNESRNLHIMGGYMQ